MNFIENEDRFTGITISNVEINYCIKNDIHIHLQTLRKRHSNKFPII